MSLVSEPVQRRKKERACGQTVCPHYMLSPTARYHKSPADCSIIRIQTIACLFSQSRLFPQLPRSTCSPCPFGCPAGSQFILLVLLPQVNRITCFLFLPLSRSLLFTPECPRSDKVPVWLLLFGQRETEKFSRLRQLKVIPINPWQQYFPNGSRC